ncbi:MAG: hypothetical protein ABSC06_37890 [Rhodopila sp.]|jgi:DNA topoisomerase VI subunit B
MFATLQGLQMQSGVTVSMLRRLALKELTDNGLDAGDAAGRPGAEIEKLDRHRYRIEDQGDGIRGTPDQLAAMFALDRPMISGKFWRLPERGALGNGVRIVIGCIATSGGTIEITSHDQRFLLRPLKNGRTEIVETGKAMHPTGTRIVVTFGPNLPEDYRDLSWSESAISISLCAGPPYARATSPHWMDAEQLHGALAYMQPPETTVRQFVERLDGCPGAKAGKIAAPFAKSRTCQSMSEADAAHLLAAMQAAVRQVKPQALGPIGMNAFNPEDYDYERQCGSFMQGACEPRATIPFIVEAWVTVTNHKGDRVQITVLANRSPVVADVTAERAYDQTIVLSGAGLGRDDVQVKLLGACSIVLHITAPFIPLLALGKRPDLCVFQIAICEAIRLAFNRSRKRLPPDLVEPKPEPPPRLEKPAKIIKPVVIAEAVPEIPAGTLRLRIEAGAEATGMSLDDLTVLTTQLDPYRLDCSRGHELGKWFADQVDRFYPPGKNVHLRGLHYRIVASADVRRPDGKPYPNTEANWIWLQSRASKAARWLGYVPFNRIRDERNEPPEIFVAEHERRSDTAMAYNVMGGLGIHPPDLSGLLPYLSWSGGRQHRQPYRVVLIGEKSSLRDVLHPIAQKVMGEMYLATGECSDTHLAEIATRANADGRPLVILYFSDFDPSGSQMAVSVARKLQALVHLLFPALRIQLHTVALTLEQVREFKLPSTPLKASEPRAEAWRKADDHEQTEIDALAALRPAVLRQIAEDAIKPFFDETLGQRADKLRAEWQSRATAWFESQPSYAEATSRITEAREEMEDAVDALNDAQRLASEKLQAALTDATGAPEPPEDTIEPAINATTPEPLFTSTDTFAFASRKLIDRKRLIGLDGDSP